MVEDLLTLTTLESCPVEEEPVDLGVIVGEVARTMSPAFADRRVRLITHAPPGAITVHGHPERLKQVLVNLLDNALRHSPPASTVTVTVQSDRGVPYLEVSDQGSGIPPEDLPRIFDRFYRVQKARTRDSGGTGLGLAIVKSIVEAGGGRVEARNNPDKGCTFRVVFRPPSP
jgi:two-component system sensor histidine kinase BaeS